MSLSDFIVHICYMLVACFLGVVSATVVIKLWLSPLDSRYQAALDESDSYNIKEL